MFIVVPRHDRLRPIVEDAIRKLYWKRYEALLPSFAPSIVAELNQFGGVECAAGLRFGREPLFLECYLDHPVEHLLAGRIADAVRRQAIVEVCHLAGVGKGRSLPFVRRLIEFLRASDVEWAIFTATRPLRSLLRRNRLTMVELAAADRSRVLHPESWGHYFEHDPRIMAVSHRTACGAQRHRMRPLSCQLDVDARVL